MSTKRRYVYNAVIQSCYRIHSTNTALHYADFDTECDMEGAELMRIDSEEKQHLIVTYLGCESISEERFLKLEQIVENQNSRISDMENTIHEQKVHIKRMNERLKYMEIKLKKNKLKDNKSDSWSSNTFGFHWRHSVYQNKDSTIKERHNIQQKEPLVRNTSDLNTSKLNFANEKVPAKIHKGSNG
ncbi:unnamed protein product [Mytilus coruscus]|uniref:Uncharacterized protein n=1 Tax=Mytilus coruscus TaxID=42192 RepID=A0A6J8CX10_MYTCO|nr:unnamed protein product [Mytilus coruscus]